MPLRNNIDKAAFQVYFCTRAKRDTSVHNEVRPETCILRSLSMFFYVRSMHVEDVKHVSIANGSVVNTQVYIYHITEHNLRSQIFRKQLLAHLDSNTVLVFLRGIEFEFAAVYGFFLSGCTIELKKKLKHLYEKAVTVTDNNYENAAIELIREIKKIQEKTQGRKVSTVQTFPIIFDNTFASISFGMPTSNVNVESVIKVSGLSNIAVKLRRQKTEKTGEKYEKPKHSRSQLKDIKSDKDSPLAVTSMELRLRKTVFEPRDTSKTENSSKRVSEISKGEIRPRKEFFTRNYGAGARVRKRIAKKIDKNNLLSNTLQPSLNNLTAASHGVNLLDVVSLNKSTDCVEELLTNSFESKSPRTDSDGISSEPSYSNASSAEGERETNDSESDSCSNELPNDLMIQHSKIYAVYVPDRWGENGEQMIYIRFPDESDHLPSCDFPCSGFSTPSTFNLSEEYKSPVDSPLVSMPQQKTIYPEPCPLYPLESSFPPVDLPVEYST